MRRVVLRLVSVLVVLVLVAGGCFVWGYAQFARPGPLAAPVAVVVPKGAGLDAIAGQLNDAGIIAYPLIFQLSARLTGADKALRAGEFAFTPRMSVRDVIDLLESGKTVVRRLTVVEGLSTAEILDHLRTVDGLEGEITLDPAEGVLLPETYHFSFGDTRDVMVQRMTQAMTDQMDALWRGRSSGLPLKTPEEAVVLASLVEKETGRPEERARIAGVFVNRLRRGMPLQSDPTVVYALTRGREPLGRLLRRSDLRTESPYNTYRVKGLPPAPICNPGREALSAALHPLLSDDLYFVADGDGGHLFARTLAEHNRNVAKWRKIQAEKGLR